MARPFLAPPFPNSPETWLAFFRRRAEADKGIHLSPEEIGRQVGVSGATVRRWEKGQAIPREEDILRLGQICSFSPLEIAFLRTVFRGRKAPLPPDHQMFRSVTQSLLTREPIPMILMDELMFVRAWNNLMPALGAQSSLLLDVERHPLESFFEAIDSGQLSRDLYVKKGWSALQTFWQFTAPWAAATEYGELVARFQLYPTLASLWNMLPDGDDPKPVDRNNIYRLFGSTECGPRFFVSYSVFSYPPMYSLIEFRPGDEEAQGLLEAARSKIELEVFFSQEDHWSKQS